jgi:hypothetical protein
MKLCRYAVAILLALTMPASARNVRDWQCGKVIVHLYLEKHWEEDRKEKPGPRITYGLRFEEVETNRINIRWRSIEEQVYLNGKRCREIPFDPANPKQD